MKCEGILKIIDKGTRQVLLEKHNRFVTSGLNQIAAVINGDSNELPGYIAVGTSPNAIVDSQTSLQGSELSRQPFISHVRTGNSIELVAEFLAGVGVGVWEEAGIFSQANGGIMFSRSLLGTYTKKDLDSIEVHWTYKFLDDGDD